MFYDLKLFAYSNQLNMCFTPSVVSNAIVTLHHDIMTYLLLIVILIIYLLNRIFFSFTYSYKPLWSNKLSLPINIQINNAIQSFKNQYYNTETILEIVWTIVPLIILSLIGLLTMSFIYNLCNYVYFPNYTVNVTGHQWYWSYVYNEYNYVLESFLIQEDYLTIGEMRLLEADNRLLLPTRSHIRIIVTSDDVVHSWAIPSLGIKIDANPGRMNHCHLFICSSNIFYGQCSELCGTGHSFMPIVIQSMPSWLFKYIIEITLQCSMK